MLVTLIGVGIILVALVALVAVIWGWIKTKKPDAANSTAGQAVTKAIATVQKWEVKAALACLGQYDPFEGDPKAVSCLAYLQAVVMGVGMNIDPAPVKTTSEIPAASLAEAERPKAEAVITEHIDFT